MATPNLLARPLALLPLLAILAGAAPAGAQSLRFVSLRPAGAGAPGDWTAVIAGKGVKTPGAVTFWADGQAVTAEAAGAGEGETARVKLKGVPAGVLRIEAARGKERDAAVGVGAESPEAGPFDDWTIYHIMVDMFANGTASNDGEITGWKHPNYAGGDLQGILEHAEYIQKLGVNAVWLSPVFAAKSSHGYDVTNYYRIAPAVAVPNDPAASLELFHKLVADLHGRGIKVILDVPLNHASAGYDRGDGDPDKLRPRATTGRQEAEKLWDSWGSGYRYWDFDHAPTRQFLKNAALFWLVRQDVDGLRLDYVRGVPHDFWAELYGEVKKAKPGAFLVGEAWMDQQGPDANAHEIATYFARLDGKPQLDSLFDFPMASVLTDVFAKGNPAVDLESWLQETEAVYGPGTHPTRFLDNHDLSRFLSWTDKPQRLTAAVTFLASLSGPIEFFYGTETGLANGAPKTGFVDAGRIPMPWKSLNEDLEGRFRKAVEARRAHPALSRGGRIPLLADRDQLVMAKVAPGETILVGVNLASEAKDVTLDLAGLLPAGAATLPPLVGDAPATVTETGQLKWHLPPLSTVLVTLPGAK